jgi:hypothetical protein
MKVFTEALAGPSITDCSHQARPRAHTFNELVLFCLFISVVFGALLSATVLWVAEVVDMAVYLTSGT